MAPRYFHVLVSGAVPGAPLPEELIAALEDQPHLEVRRREADRPGQLLVAVAAGDADEAGAELARALSGSPGAALAALELSRVVDAAGGWTFRRERCGGVADAA